MEKLPAIKAKEFVRFLQTVGFQPIRQKGSHVRMRHSDGRVTTVPIHGNSPLPKGLLRAIIKNDLDFSREEFLELWTTHKKK